MKLTFHHINFVSKDINELNSFYKNILQMDTVPESNFPRTDATDNSGYSGKIKFVTEGKIQMHLAEKNLDVAKKNKQHINPVEKGHIAYRTDDIEAFKNHLKENGIEFTDWGNIGVSGWHQIFFYDPDGNIIEVHQKI